jgi:hypothetical protein
METDRGTSQNTHYAAGSCSPRCPRALSPLPNRPQQYSEHCESRGKTKREVNCVGVNHVGAPGKQRDWGSDGIFVASTLFGQLPQSLE